jgi:hypothetical protein
MCTLIVLQVQTPTDLLARLAVLGRGAEAGALSIGLAAALMLVGWGLAVLVSRLVRSVLRILRVDQAVRGLRGPRAAARHEPAAVAGWAAYWLIMAVAALLALETLGFDLATPVAQRLGDVVPRILASAVLFAIGSVVALFAGRVTRRFLASADIRLARLQGQIVSAVLTGFAALMALDQLGFAAQFVMAIGVVAVAAAGLGLALAFGLGCRDFARDFVVEYLRSLDEDRPQRPE